MEHYFSEQSEAKHNERVIDFRFHGIDFRFHSDDAVFSKNHIDEASKLLLEALQEERAQFQAEELDQFLALQKGHALDLGCGYGVLGIVSKRLYPALSWTLSDVNERALALARKNIEENQALGIKVQKSDGFEELEERYTLVVSNPPIRIGKEALYRLLDGVANQLEQDGLFYMVIGKKQGAESCGRFLETRFRDVRIARRKKGFTVYACKLPLQTGMEG